MNKNILLTSIALLLCALVTYFVLGRRKGSAWRARERLRIRGGGAMQHAVRAQE